jgi:hypothetical protein
MKKAFRKLCNDRFLAYIILAATKPLIEAEVYQHFRDHRIAFRE